MTKEAKKFVKMMLRKNPNERPSAEELLKNKWILRNLTIKSSKDIIKVDSMLFHIRKSNKLNLFERGIVSIIMQYYSECEEFQKLKRLFTLFDRNKDGYLTKNEVKKALHCVLGDIKSRKQLYSELFKNKSLIKYNEFLAAAISK